MRRTPPQLAYRGLACGALGACASAASSVRAPGTSAPYTAATAMQIVPLPNSKYNVDSTPITCEQGALARDRAPSGLDLTGPGSIGDAICLSTLAHRLGMRVHGADGAMHEIRGHL